MNTINTSTNTGINNTLLIWAESSKLVEVAFGKEGSSLIELFEAFFGGNDNQRKIAAIDLYNALWKAHRVFGPKPPIELLEKFEHDRVFYADYRDHTVHTVITCLLGLYIYENCTIIKDAVYNYLIDKCVVTESTSQDDVHNRFIETWLLASLYHDIGYLAENRAIDDNKSAESQVFFTAINKRLKTPLSETPFFSTLCNEVSETKYITDNSIFTKSIDSANRFEAPQLFEPLKDASSRTHLAISSKNGIEEYYHFARGGHPAHRDSGLLAPEFHES